MIQRFRIGNNLTMNWLLYEDYGNIHNLEGKTLELYMTCGGFKYPVTNYTVTENAIAWVFPASHQTKTGYYKFVLVERDPVRGLYSYDVAHAFCLEPKHALTNIDTIIDEDATVQVRSVLTYAHITNLASIDTVETSDGKSTTVVVHLTNGKSFALPFSPGSGSGQSYVLQPATDTRLGGIRIGFTQDGNKYPVKLDPFNNAYVEVPENGGINVLDTLYSNSKVDALSANSGRVLRELIESLPAGGGGGGEGGEGGSKYVVYLDEAGPTPGRPGPTMKYSFKTASDYWVRTPKTGDIAVYANGDGYIHAYELIVSEEEGEDKEIYSTNRMLNFQLFIADLSQGGGGGGEPGEPGEPGRSITSVQHWFKLTADESVQATPMSVADPSSSAGGSWSQTAGSPSVQYPYLRCFMQVNYDQPLANGYTYTRSSAFTARYFNSDSTADYQELVDALSSLRQELLADLAGYDATFAALNTALEGIRSTLSGSIKDQLDDLRDRLDQINGTDVELIMNDGLWAVLTSWQSATGDKKAFADIIANAQEAKVLLQTGSTFFDRAVGGNITLDGILGQISARLTEQQARGLIQSATISVDSAALSSVIAASQSWWRKNGVLYPYDLFWSDFLTDDPQGTLYEYSAFMQKAPSAGGPQGDTDRPDGPYEEVVIVNQFSQIKQTVDEISASVDTTKYMWQKGNQYASYDAFETNWENRSQSYISYTYEQYVTNVLGYTKVEVGAALSNITQTSDEIRAIVGDAGYFWKKILVGGGYDYQRYAVPSNQTRDEYVAAMQSAGWTLVTYASRMSVVDQFPDSITALVKNSTLCWIDSSATGAAYCRDYDYWLSDYQASVSLLTYEEWVAANHSSYELAVVTDSFSRIKQTADSITSAVADIEGHETRLSAVEQTAEEISLSVSKVHSCWKDNATGELYEYNAFSEDYETYKESATNPLEYEDWVENTQNCTLSDSFEEVSGIKLQGDKIWAGVGDGDDLKASIEIIADAETDDGKIILDADNVIINGGLQAGVVKAGTIDAKAVTTDKLDTGAVTAAKIDSGAVTTEKLYAEAVTAGKIAAGAITADKIDAGAITTDKLQAGSVTMDKLDVESITVDGLLAENATVNNEFTANNINVAGGTIGNLTVDNGGLNGVFTGEVTVNSQVYDLKNEVTIDESKFEFGSEVTGRSSGNVMSSGALTIGMEASNAAGGFVEIDCTKRASIVGAVPKFDCGLKVTAENAANAIEANGNVFVDGTLAGRIPIYTNDPRIETKVSSPINLGYKDNGAFIGAYADTQINLNSSVATNPGFHVKILVMNTANTISINGSSLRPSWLRYDGSQPDVGIYSTTSSISFNTVGLYELFYVGKETYTTPTNGRSGTYDKFILCKLS